MMYLSLEIFEKALTEVRKEEHRMMYDEDDYEEGYYIDEQLKVEEICVEEKLGENPPRLTITGYADGVYLRLEVPISLLIKELFRTDGFKRLLDALEDEKKVIEQAIDELKTLESQLKRKIVLKLVDNALEGDEHA